MKPEPSVGARSCWVAVIDSETAMMLRAQSHHMDVRAGDLIQTPACAMQMGTDALDEVYSLTR